MEVNGFFVDKHYRLLRYLISEGFMQKQSPQKMCVSNEFFLTLSMCLLADITLNVGLVRVCVLVLFVCVCVHVYVCVCVCVCVCVYVCVFMCV